jgi:hypothetical protein
LNQIPSDRISRKGDRIRFHNQQGLTNLDHRAVDPDARPQQDVEIPCGRLREQPFQDIARNLSNWQSLRNRTPLFDTR